MMAAGTRHRWTAVTAATAAAVMLGCSPAQTPKQEATVPAGPNVVEVTATEFAYSMPDTIPAGPTLFRQVNSGAQLHHMQVVRLEEGKTIADLAKMDPAAVVPSWMVELGGPNTAHPGGGVSEGILDLTPGNYVVFCGIPGPDGVPHVMKGMAHSLTVVPSSETRTLPAPDLTITLNDYSFATSAPITAGHHVIRVVNAGPQSHEIVIAKLDEGRTPEDLLRWVEKQDGPPPGTPIGGTTGIATGREQLVPIDLAPGNYALICFFPDAKDGQPHFVHGMVQQITVQ